MQCLQSNRNDKKLHVNFSGSAKIEVGGPYVGVSFHHSSMIPQRISFFYPVANSIDRSRDYWTRDTSFVADWYLEIGNDSIIALGRQATEYELTPYSVKFVQTDTDYSIKSHYQFCKDKPAMILEISVTNISDQTKNYQLDTRLWASIRTCHRYRWVEQARTATDSTTIYTHFNDPEANSATIFVANADELPIYCNSHFRYLNKPHSMEAKQTPSTNKPTKPVTQFIYQKRLKPGEVLHIVQIIGSAARNETQPLVRYLKNNYRIEIANYEKYVLKKAYSNHTIQTGSPQTDHSIAYAKAVLAANAHYLDGEIVPMPCPAEYNFYFTHDALVTDLAAVYFDLARVKRDLEYIIRHANPEKIIPHAYYWRDGKYVTEYADTDNWNNFWFIQVSAKYLRHSGDKELVETLYPCIQKSVQRALLNLKDDNLIWSYRPDWWDIGHNYGPRSYMTILAIKTLQDYMFISTVLGKNLDQLSKYGSLVENMQAALNEKLWHDEMHFLINYHNDGSLDEHYYIGSLLAAHYGLLKQDKSHLLVQTATEKMVDPAVGIYNAFPMDFDQWAEFMQFSVNEVGVKYHYFNGGIWPQGNAWYALALIANQEKEAAAEFIDNTISLYGIMGGPNGQPAYYEVRNANKNAPTTYGTVDKPQFLWAAGWYLYAMYQLYGLHENSWNIQLAPFLLTQQKKCVTTLKINSKNSIIEISGDSASETLSEIRYDGIPYPSLVIPEKVTPQIIKLDLGQIKHPYLKSAHSQLVEAKITKGNHLILILKAFQDHKSQSVIHSPTPLKQVFLNGIKYDHWQCKDFETYYENTIRFKHKQPNIQMNLVFE